MQKSVLVLLCLLLSLITLNVSGRTFEKKEWTMLLYFSGDNNLSLNFSRAIDQFRKFPSNESVHVVIQSDGMSQNDSKRRYFLPPDNNGNEETIIFEENIEYDMGSEKTLADFVKWGVNTFPSKRTILVISGHGSGALFLPFGNDGFSGIDINTLGSSPDGSSKSYFDEVTMTEELKAALGNKKIDLLIYNSCYMGSMEVMYELSAVFNYAIVSEDAILLNNKELYRDNQAVGPSYHYLPSLLLKNPKVSIDEIGKFLMKEHYKSYVDFVYTSEGYIPNKVQQTLVNLDLTKMADVRGVYEAVVKEMIVAAADDPSIYKRFYKEFFSLSKIYIAGYLDVGLVAKVYNRILNSSSSYALLELLYGTDFIKSKSLINVEHSLAGVSVFIPYDFYPVYLPAVMKARVAYDRLAWMKASNHKEFIDDYLNYIIANKPYILSDMIYEYLSTGKLEVFRARTLQRNENHLFMAFAGFLPLYSKKQNAEFLEYHYNRIAYLGPSSEKTLKHIKYVKKVLTERYGVDVSIDEAIAEQKTYRNEKSLPGS